MDNGYSKKTIKNMPKLIEAIQSNDEDEIEKAIELFDERDQDDFDADELLDIAIREEAYDYVDEHLDDVDLYDFHWTSVAETEEMIDFLMERGAARDPDYYVDYAFSYCVDTDYVLAFDDEFRKTAIKKYMNKIGLSEEKLCEYLDGDTDDAYDGNRDIEEDAEALGFYSEDGKVVVGETNEAGRAIIDVLDWLGYECKFQGCSWKLETSGYYYID